MPASSSARPAAAGHKYRLYVDEVGNQDMDPVRAKPAERYLSLTGIIVDLDYVRTTLSPAVETLKARYFNSHPDDPVVLHRRELLKGAQPFHALQDAKVRASFDRDLIALLRNLDYSVITAVIDKWDHWSRLGVWSTHPYHYCMQVLVERFVLELNQRGVVGDVMAESRGAREDKDLKNAFSEVYKTGSAGLLPAVLQKRLTSRELKVQPKSANIAGLQLADLIAYPAYKTVVARRNNQSLPPDFSGTVGAMLEASKFRRSPDGRIAGWGTKWLP